MKVTLTAEMWITRAPDGTLELGPPIVTMKATGLGAAGAVTPAPYVLRAGTTLLMTAPAGWNAG